MDEMNLYFLAGWMLGQFDSMTQEERLELRVRRMVEWRIWWKKVLGRTFPIREKSYRLQWPDVPEAEKERFCEDWRCRKKVPAGRLVCPWCGRFERITDFDWMDVLNGEIVVEIPADKRTQILRQILGLDEV